MTDVSFDQEAGLPHVVGMFLLFKIAVLIEQSLPHVVGMFLY